jgi:hypothetical protein
MVNNANFVAIYRDLNKCEAYFNISMVKALGIADTDSHVTLYVTYPIHVWHSHSAFACIYVIESCSHSLAGHPGVTRIRGQLSSSG